VLLEVLLGGGDELDGGELEAAALEAGDDGADEAALGIVSYVPKDGRHLAYLDAIRLDRNEATYTLATPPVTQCTELNLRLLASHCIEVLSFEVCGGGVCKGGGKKGNSEVGVFSSCWQRGVC
jgi:hypothetical protein